MVDARRSGVNGRGRGRGHGRQRGLVIERSPASATSAADLALLSLFDPDPTDDDETDPLTESLVDDLALMLVW